MSWSSHTFVTGELVTAAQINGMFPTVTQTDVSGSRAINATVYQNTSGKLRLVLISVYLEVADVAAAVSGYSRVTCYCDSSNPPTTGVAKANVGVSQANLGTFYGDHILAFFVKPNYYYKATAAKGGDGADPTLTYWTEWDLF